MKGTVEQTKENKLNGALGNHSSHSGIYRNRKCLSTMKTIARSIRLRPALLLACTCILIAGTSSSCLHTGPPPDCGPNGEFVEGDCVCDEGWGGADCNAWLADTYAGVYVVESDTCVAYGIGFDSLRIFGSLVAPRGIFLEASNLRRPITAIIGWNTTEADIPLQENVRIDSSGGETPISIQGRMRHWNSTSDILITLDSCTVRLGRL
jgi:hypothetical protein